LKPYYNEVLYIYFLNYFLLSKNITSGSPTPNPTEILITKIKLTVGMANATILKRIKLIKKVKIPTDINSPQ
jgi:hypothetical protein